MLAVIPAAFINLFIINMIREGMRRLLQVEDTSVQLKHFSLLE